MASSARVGFIVADVDAAVDAVAGFTVIAAAKDSPWGRRAVIADPDGLRVELVTPVLVGKCSVDVENAGCPDRTMPP
jgi:predicted enzyme related to lactoylglutathione lyase